MAFLESDETLLKHGIEYLARTRAAILSWITVSVFVFFIAFHASNSIDVARKRAAENQMFELMLQISKDAPGSKDRLEQELRLERLKKDFLDQSSHRIVKVPGIDVGIDVQDVSPIVATALTFLLLWGLVSLQHCRDVLEQLSNKRGEAPSYHVCQDLVRSILGRSDWPKSLVERFSAFVLILPTIAITIVCCHEGYCFVWMTLGSIWKLDSPLALPADRVLDSRIGIVLGVNIVILLTSFVSILCMTLQMDRLRIAFDGYFKCSPEIGASGFPATPSTNSPSNGFTNNPLQPEVVRQLVQPSVNGETFFTTGRNKAQKSGQKSQGNRPKRNKR